MVVIITIPKIIEDILRALCKKHLNLQKYCKVGTI